MLVIKIKTGNAAFEGANLYPELIRIFNNIAKYLEDQQMPRRILDINGNHVGDIEWQ